MASAQQVGVFNFRTYRFRVFEKTLGSSTDWVRVLTGFGYWWPIYDRLGIIIGYFLSWLFGYISNTAFTGCGTGNMWLNTFEEGDIGGGGLWEQGTELRELGIEI